MTSLEGGTERGIEGPMPQRLTGNLIALLGMALWSTSFPVTHALLEGWHPLPLVAARLGISAVFLLVLMAVTGRPFRLNGVNWRDFALLGGLGLGLSTTLLVWGQDYSNPVTVAIIVTTMPLISASMGLFAGQERFTPMLVLAIACAIAGGILASWPPEGAKLGFRGGEILAVGAVIGFTWFSRGTVSRLAAVPDIAKTAFMMSAATIVTLAAAVTAAAGGTDLRLELTWPSIGLILWLGCVSNGVSMVCWLIAARKLGVTVAAIHLNGVPFYVILLALAVGGTLFMSQIWGAVLVAAGALLAQLPDLGRRDRLSATLPD